ncbi:MAG: DUF1013 domain-containing protein [Alphaproteobacteria bacterium]|nr:DUF1013 domain-containing protein [Alphaproteobacteria bacterium]
MSNPLMPKATAVWLVDNTSLTFDQIADFCGLHQLEIKGIADGEVAQGIKGLDPIANGQLTRDEIERCSADPGTRLAFAKTDIQLPERRTKVHRYTPLSKRQDRPNAISWLIRYQAELTDAQIAKLVGTTKPTIQSVRDRSHWNMPNIKPQDPVTLGLCSQVDLDEAVRTAQAREERKRIREEKAAAKAKAAQLAAAEAAGAPSTQPVPEQPTEEPTEEPNEEPTAAPLADAAVEAVTEAEPDTAAEPAPETASESPEPVGDEVR